MKKLLFVSGAALIVVAAFLFFSGSSKLNEGEVLQSGVIEISNSLTYRHNIVYPEKFRMLPRIDIKLRKGSGNLEIIEQRTDGFIFTASNLGYSVAEGAHVEWSAIGLLPENK